uniref:uncharacterized protein isoform X3 n=1 Tax=Myxine glutinosa TaxID=7769 RepID=UPI00358E5FD2
MDLGKNVSKGFGCRKRKQEGEAKFGKEKCLKREIKVSLQRPSPSSTSWDMRGWRPPDDQKSFPHHIPFGRMVLRSAQSKKFNDTCPADILVETDDWQISSSPFQDARNTSQGNEVSLHMSSPCSPVWDMRGWRSPDEQKSFPLDISFGRMVLRSARSKKFNETYPPDILEETDYWQSRSSFLNIPVDILTPERSHQQLGSSPFQVARNTSQGNEVSSHMSSPCSPVWEMSGWRSPDEQKSFPLDISFGRLVLRSARSKKFNETYPADILEETDYWQSRSSFLNIPVDILTPERSHQQLGSSPFQVARNTSQANQVSLHMASPYSPYWNVKGCQATDEQKCSPLPCSFRHLALKSPQSKNFDDKYPADILWETDHQQIRSPPF